jgi:hypothetical protein
MFTSQSFAPRGRESPPVRLSFPAGGMYEVGLRPTWPDFAQNPPSPGQRLNGGRVPYVCVRAGSCNRHAEGPCGCVASSAYAGCDIARAAGVFTRGIRKARVFVRCEGEGVYFLGSPDGQVYDEGAV